ncbi:MAG: glycosyltransferase family 4 protein, partial [Calditrichaeota bacterium]|nr:glycosyltransferase family 4 protein [Calditrichota bacterium]
MKICMLLMTAFTHDARVTKEALSLIKIGHKVTFYALKDKDSPAREKRHGFYIYRISLKTRYLLPKGQLFFFIKYLEYLIRTIIALLNKPFDVYHAHDLETLPIAFIIGKLKNKPIIYDSHELYTETVKHHPIARK